MNLILFGAPGAGKGTQARLLSEKYGLKHCSTGELLREEIRSGSSLGSEIGGILKAGSLVPDSMIVEMVSHVLIDSSTPSRPVLRAGGFVLDGFPRTLPQAAALTAMLERVGESIHHVIVLDVDEEILLSRIRKRIAESGSDVRSDDSAEVLQRRLRIYREQTRPILPYYEARGLIRMIDGMQPIETVTAQIDSIVTE